MTLTISSDLKTYKSFQKAIRFSKDRDFVIHARLCHLCPAPWTLLQFHPERKVDIKRISLFSTSHPVDSGMLLLNWRWWFWGTNSPRWQPKFSEWVSLSAKSTSPSPYEHWCWSHYCTGCCCVTEPGSSGKRVIQVTEATCSIVAITIHMRAHLPCSTFILEAAFTWLRMAHCESLHTVIAQRCSCTEKPSLGEQLWAVLP